MNAHYSTVQSFLTRSVVALLIGSGLCVGNAGAQNAKTKSLQPGPKDRPAGVSQTNSAWGRGGAFEGFTPEQEIKENRSRNSKHFRNADGSITVQTGRTMHYRDAVGGWQEIDLSIVAGDGGFQNLTNGIKSRFPQAPGQQGVGMTLENGMQFSWWQNPTLSFVNNGQTVKTLAAQPAAGQTRNGVLTYQNLYTGISEEFVIRTNGMESSTIIHSLNGEIAALPADAKLQFSQFIPLQAGWEVVASDNQVKTNTFEADRFFIRMPGSKENIHFGRVIVFDNNIGKKEAMLIQAPAEKIGAEQRAKLQQSVLTVKYKVRFVNGGIEVLTVLPASWLQAGSRAFPVTVDPTVTITPTNAFGDVFGPLTHYYGFQRHANLYLNSEVGSFGTITQIEYNCVEAGTAGSTPTKVYMRTTPATELSDIAPWNSNSYTGAGATLCLNANTDQGNTTGWKALSLTTPFNYTQDNLMIMVSDFWGDAGDGRDYNMSEDYVARQAYIREDDVDPGDGEEIEDIEDALPEIRITYTLLTACSGVPALGTATSTATTACAGTTFSLNLPGIPAETGYSYQWQSSPDGLAWTNLGTAQSTPPYTTSLSTQGLSYRLIVTCTPSGDADTSTAVTVALSPANTCYCTPTGANCGLDDEIQNVTFAGINNNSVCIAGGYTDYSGSVAAATIAGGVTYPISVTVGEGGNEAVGVWIDFNQNGVFDMTEFTYVANTPGGTAVTANINVPPGALAGNTRMRVRSFYVASGDPLTVYNTTPNSSCAAISTNFGETEDYMVTVTAATACTGEPEAGTIAASVSGACAATPFDLNTTGNTVASGISYQWQSSTNGTTWNNLGAAQNFTAYTVTNQTQTTQYRLIITCTASSESDTSNTITITQNAPAGCVCTPELDCTDADVITNVTFVTINNNSACAPTGYTNYSGTVAPATVMASATAPISVTVGNGFGSESVSVWIDYNQNGVFEAGEFTLVGTGSGSVVTGNINIPGTALSGNTLMRVRVAAVAGNLATSDLACNETQVYGETEDYAITITPAPVIDSVVVTTQGGVPAQIATPTGTLQLQAIVFPLPSPQTVTWSIVPVTGTATISAAGLVTGQTAGTVWGKATSTINPTKKDSILITIQNTVITVDSVVVTTQGGVPAQIATPTGTLQLQATVYPATVAQTVTWAIVPVTGTATISAAGLVTGQTAGTVWGKATSTVDATKKDSILITIQNNTIAVDSVVVTTAGGVAANISVPDGTLQLQAAVFPATVAQTVTWTIVPVTGSATISATGQVTAVWNGTVWGKATSTVDPTKSDSILITITQQDMSIEDVFTALDFNLFPNPTADLVTVKSSKNHSALQLQIVDLTGKVLMNRMVQANELATGVTLDMTGFSSGLYILKLQGENVQVNKQVIRR